MNNLQKVFRLTLMGLLIVCAYPSCIAGKLRTGQNAATLSTSGKIISIATGSFTIAQEEQRPPASQFLEDEHPAAMTFMLTRDTKIKGKIEVGASADIQYQKQDGNNFAVTVQVTAVT